MIGTRTSNAFLSLHFLVRHHTTTQIIRATPIWFRSAQEKGDKKNQVNDGLEDVWWAFEIFMIKSDILKNIKTNIFNNDCTFYNKFNISRQYQLWRTKARGRVFLIYPTHTYKDHFCKLFKLKKLNKSLGSIYVSLLCYIILNNLFNFFLPEIIFLTLEYIVYK